MYFHNFVSTMLYVFRQTLSIRNYYFSLFTISCRRNNRNWNIVINICFLFNILRYKIQHTEISKKKISEKYCTQFPSIIIFGERECVCVHIYRPILERKEIFYGKQNNPREVLDSDVLREMTSQMNICDRFFIHTQKNFL